MKTPDYGLDAPGLCRNFLLIGGSAYLLLFIAAVSLGDGEVQRVLYGLLGVVGTYCFLMGALMVLFSKVIKLRTREAMLDQHPWQGSEAFLDVGCGRGLLLVGAAKRAPKGRGVGIDIWAAKDQSHNHPGAAQENAALAGVETRLEVHTGNATDMSQFEDGSFDVVMSHWVIHNIEPREARRRALVEMVRVLRPGGTLLLADIAHHKEYLQALPELGVQAGQLRQSVASRIVLQTLSGGSFHPGWISAVKAIS